ncbi:fatty acid desaturase family protein [Nocardioides soli]|uniref:Fatty acid desaturase n=1 Tax=Nocardioides soli TaxID=1036020 RepID=A0A7W4VXE6_9ACTN|nr:acyl-CoA desaturase [Nocardioides soli]MBB3043258.1 fatty acid desaturase [Nocardioides soli]
MSRQVRETGLLGRRLWYYWSWILAATVAFGLLWVAFGMLGNSWLQLIVAASLGVLATQFGFLGHDAAHRQIFTSARCNTWTARLLATLFVGMSHSWWRSKHNRHHGAPNQEGRDPDIGPGVIAFTRAAAARRTRGVPGWFTRHQGWLFFPLLTLEGINLHLASVRPLLTAGASRQQRTEATLVLLRLAAYVAVVVSLLPPGKAAAFLGLQAAVLGVCLGGSFAPNHKGMPIVPPEARIDFLRRQVLMSRNVRGGPLVDIAMGGLNYQIEHHLFPSMPRPNLRFVQPLVRDYCARHEVTYTEVALLESYRIVIDYLNHVGLRARTPFDCPLAGQLRG